VDFDVAVFTNLTQDHLDYHHDLESYFEAKVLLFEQLAGRGSVPGAPPCADPGPAARRAPVAVVNSDDAYGRRLVKRLSGRVATATYGLGLRSGFRGLDRVSDFDGTRFKLKAKGREFLVRLPLIGSYNVHNALAALAAGNALGINLRESVETLASAPQVPGRLESVAEGKPFRVFVDYAHTPDALENVLVTLRELGPRRLVTVFGCGGDRDRGKRPLMGAVAEHYSDACIVTSDNPRSEPPAAIIKEITLGMSAGRHTTVEDRQEAIFAAIAMARAGDFVLIAGKGHEDYQETAAGTVPFDDRKVARWALQEWKNPRAEDAAQATPPRPPRPSGPGGKGGAKKKGGRG
jgi:UDP-N-acetylmuramoyl-L-alanyl-D-glutamate--2,6-diaminopimelate ligase